MHVHVFFFCVSTCLFCIPIVACVWCIFVWCQCCTDFFVLVVNYFVFLFCVRVRACVLARSLAYVYVQVLCETFNILTLNFYIIF